MKTHQLVSQLFDPHSAFFLLSRPFLSGYLVVDIKNSLLDFVVDLSRGVDEGLFHVGRRLGRSLHEDEAVLAGKGFALLTLNVAAGLQITKN